MPLAESSHPNFLRICSKVLVLISFFGFTTLEVIEGVIWINFENSAFPIVVAMICMASRREHDSSLTKVKKKFLL